MKLADGVEMLEITVDFMGRRSIVYPVVIYDKDDAALVDTGYPGTDGTAQIRRQARDTGIPFDKLSKIFITHQDMDHIGGIPELVKTEAQKIEVIAHAEEKPYIEGTKRLIKITPERMAAIKALPEEQRKQMEAVYADPPKAPVAQTVSDGEEVPCCGGIVVIHTPGHTPGHICLYLKQSKILIAGDALNIADGSLTGPNPEYTKDMDSARASLKKLAQYDIRTVVCYHGGAYSQNVNQRIAELAG